MRNWGKVERHGTGGVGREGRGKGRTLSNNAQCSKLVQVQNWPMGKEHSHCFLHSIPETITTGTSILFATQFNFSIWSCKEVVVPSLLFAAPRSLLPLKVGIAQAPVLGLPLPFFNPKWILSISRFQIPSPKYVSPSPTSPLHSRPFMSNCLLTTLMSNKQLKLQHVQN